jgi:hypothetical protein
MSKSVCTTTYRQRFALFPISTENHHTDTKDWLHTPIHKFKLKPIFQSNPESDSDSGSDLDSIFEPNLGFESYLNKESKSKPIFRSNSDPVFELKSESYLNKESKSKSIFQSNSDPIFELESESYLNRESKPTSIKIKYWGEVVKIMPIQPDRNHYYLTWDGDLFRGEDSINSPSEFYFLDISTKQIYQVTDNPHNITPVDVSLSI